MFTERKLNSNRINISEQDAMSWSMKCLQYYNKTTFYYLKQGMKENNQPHTGTSDTSDCSGDEIREM